MFVCTLLQKRKKHLKYVEAKGDTAKVSVSGFPAAVLNLSKLRYNVEFECKCRTGRLHSI